MNKKNNIHKTLFTFIPASLIIGTLIFASSNVKDIKPVHADSNYSLTIDGGSTINFIYDSTNTYVAEINENVRRNTRITFYDGANEMTYSDTCYADYLDNSNNLYNNIDGNFITKYGVNTATIRLSISNNKYIFYMSGIDDSLENISNIDLSSSSATYYEDRLYVLSDGHDYVTSYGDNSLLLGDESPLYISVKKIDNNYAFKFISLNKYLSSSGKGKLTLTETIETTFVKGANSGSYPNRINSPNGGTLAVKLSGVNPPVTFQDHSALTGTVLVRLYEVKERSNIKCDELSYTFPYEDDLSIDVSNTIDTSITVDDLSSSTISKEGLIYSVIYDEYDVAHLDDDNILHISDIGAFTIMITREDIDSICYAPFIIYDENIAYDSNIKIMGSDEFSNLLDINNAPNHSVYDYNNDFSFVAKRLYKMSNTTIGVSNALNKRSFVIYNQIPIVDSNLSSISKITIKGDFVTSLECEFSYDKNFTNVIKGEKITPTILKEASFIPSDNNTYPYFRLYNELGASIEISEIFISIGNDLAASYASSFNEDFCAICELVVSGDKGLVDIINEWNIQKEIFIILKEESLDAADRLKNATYTDENIDIAEFALKYDYIYGKYHSSLDDYIGRNPVKLSQGKNVYHYLSESEDQSILIIVISGTALLLVSTASLLIILLMKKKKQ